MKSKLYFGRLTILLVRISREWFSDALDGMFLYFSEQTNQSEVVNFGMIYIKPFTFVTGTVKALR